MRFSPCLCALHVSFISSLICLTYSNIYFEESGLRSYIFPSSRASRPVPWPTQPPIPPVLEALSPGVERPEWKADHSPSSSAGVNDKCSYTSVPPYAFIAYIQTCPLPFEIIKPRIMQFWSPYYFLILSSKYYRYSIKHFSPQGTLTARGSDSSQAYKTKNGTVSYRMQ
jgi:hypothetical protein